MSDIQNLDTNKSRPVAGSGRVNRFLFVLAKMGYLQLNKKKDHILPIGINIKMAREFCEKYSMKRVLLVGSNPGQASPDNTAFHPATKSRQFVDRWLDDSWHVVYDNLVNFKTAKNKQLSKSQIKENIEHIKHNIGAYRRMGYPIVACGKIASMGLTMAEIDHFEMPHPSGLCRFWNDKEAGEAKIKEMKEWAQNLPYPKEKR